MMLQKPPMSVDVGGLNYDIDSDFRTMIEVENLIMGKTVTEEQKAFADEITRFNSEISFEDACINAKYYEALKLFYKENIPDNLEKAIDSLVWFYGCGKREQAAGRGKKQLYSYRYDFDYINAGFLQDYKIDLFEIEFLHWWKFVSLFSALRDDCKIREIMGYRGADTKGMDKEQKRFIREKQKLYALPMDELSKEEKELKDKLRDALLNGGDVSGILKSEKVLNF